MEKKGFTLIEFMMVVVILGVIIGIGAPLLVEVTEGWLLGSQRKELSFSAKLAMDVMTREIRRIRNRTSILTAAGSNLRFIDIDDHDITFDVSSQTLRRNLDGVVNGLADNLSSLSFTYYNSAGATLPVPVASPSDIRRIEITTAFSTGATQLSFKSGVSPRRLQ
jgi:prepilin-type N-terminal cleavage/methylation domain-containing protein